MNGTPQGGSPVDLTGLLGAAGAAAATPGNSLGNTLGALAGLTGLPGAGLVGQLLGQFLGGSSVVKFGAAKNAAAPHRPAGLGGDLLDMSDWNEDDGNLFARLALGHGCTVEDVSGVVNQEREMAHRPTWLAVVQYFRENEGQFSSRLDRYRTANPGLGYAAGGSSAAPGNGFAGLGFTGSAGGGAGAAPVDYGQAAAAASAQNMTLADYLKALASGAWAGAQAGAGSAIAKTPAGQEIKKQQVNAYIKDYQLPIAISLAGIAWLAYRAFSR